MQKIVEKSLPALLSPLMLIQVLNENNFSQKFRILEANFGTGSKDDFEKEHIKYAIYFDTLNGVESTKMYPRDLPKQDNFKEYISNLGISNQHHLILYDRSQFGFFASSRAWWIFRLFGHEKVSILSGGLNLWKKNNFQLASNSETFQRENFEINFNNSLIRRYDDIIKNIDSKKEQVIDARPRDDFNKINPVLGLPNNIPNSKNIPYPELFDVNTGTIKETDKLAELFKNEGIDLNSQLISSCNTSVTGSSLAFAAYLLGAENVPVYQGSWTEYSLKKEEEQANRVIS